MKASSHDLVARLPYFVREPQLANDNLHCLAGVRKYPPHSIVNYRDIVRNMNAQQRRDHDLCYVYTT